MCVFVCVSKQPIRRVLPQNNLSSGQMPALRTFLSEQLARPRKSARQRAYTCVQSSALNNNNKSCGHCFYARRRHSVLLGCCACQVFGRFQTPPHPPALSGRVTGHPTFDILKFYIECQVTLPPTPNHPTLKQIFVNFSIFQMLGDIKCSEQQSITRTVPRCRHK